MPSIKKKIASILARRAARAAMHEMQHRAEQVGADFTEQVNAFLGDDAETKLQKEKMEQAQATATWLLSLKDKARKFEKSAGELESKVLTAIETEAQFAKLAPAQLSDYQTFLKKTTENAAKIQSAVNALRTECTAQNVKKLETAIARAAKDYTAWSENIVYMGDGTKGISKAVAFELKKPFIKVGRWLSDLASSASAYFKSATLLEETKLIQSVLELERTERAEAKEASSGVLAMLRLAPNLQENQKIASEETLLLALETASKGTPETLKQVTDLLDQVLSAHAEKEAAAATQKKYAEKPERKGQPVQDSHRVGDANANVWKAHTKVKKVIETRKGTKP